GRPRRRLSWRDAPIGACPLEPDAGHRLARLVRWFEAHASVAPPDIAGLSQAVALRPCWSGEPSGRTGGGVRDLHSNLHRNWTTNNHPNASPGREAHLANRVAVGE